MKRLYPHVSTEYGSHQLVVAALNSPPRIQERADFVCSGKDDQGVFADAFTLSPSVIQAPGDYYFSDTLRVPYPSSFSGCGQGISNIHCNGTFLPIEIRDKTVKKQKLHVFLSDFSLFAPGVEVAIDLTGHTYGSCKRVQIKGVEREADLPTESVGVLWDGSLSASIGCWWNVLEDCRIEGFTHPVRITGKNKNGQANSNQIYRCRIGGYTKIGVDIDEADVISVRDSDISSSWGNAIGVRCNDINCVIAQCRFELNDIGVLVDGNSGRLQLYPCTYSGCSVGVKVDSGAIDTYIHEGSLFWNVGTEIQDNSSSTKIK